MITTSPEQAIAQMSEPRYFIQRFFHVISKTTNQKIPFIFNFVQQKYYKVRSRYDLILKARKEGFTSLVLAIWLVSCLFIQNTRAVVVSHEDDATKRLFAKVKFYLETMGVSDQKFAVTLDDDSKKQITFPLTNSSFWIGTAGSRTFGRGDDITLLLLSEVAHYKNQDFLTGLIAACTPTAWHVMETTANGIGERFNLMWEEAGDPQGGSGWKRHFFGWFEDPTHSAPVPEHLSPLLLTAAEARMRESIKAGTGVEISDAQIYWYRQTYNSMPDKSKMVQEYPSNAREAFISSGRHVFNIQKLDEYLQRCTPAQWVGELTDDGHTVQFRDNPEGPFSMWKNRRDGRRYLISADVAKGVLDGAWSVARVWDRSSWEPVAMYRARLDPGDFGEVLTTMGYFLNNAILAPENNNHGWACLERIKSIKYKHVLRTSDLWADEKHPDFGFPTDERTQGLLISAVRNAVDDGSYFEYSDFCIGEMMRAVFDDYGKMVCQSGWTDSIIATGIGLYCLKFLTLDETYRESTASDAPLVASSVAGHRGGRTGYTRRFRRVA